MENNRDSWGSKLGFILASVGSAVGLGNIWGFPYKMGKSGGFTFLLIYVLLAVFVGLVIMASEFGLGRKIQSDVVGSYKAASKKFTWVGWMALLSPLFILAFYMVLGGYCVQYMSINLAELSFKLSNLYGTTISGGDTFGAMLTNPVGCAIFTLALLILCMFIVKGGVSAGIEKFNQVGMPALFVMLIIVVIRSLTLPNAVEGLKFMFVPGYAVQAGFIDEAPSIISVLATAGGQMFFSLSLAMGIIVTYGSYLKKGENIVKSSGVIVFCDTLVALLAGLAVIPAAVANGISNGIPVNEIALGGPKLLFVTLQDVFSNMGTFGSLFGVIFYLLVIIAAISSIISLIEVLTTFVIDSRTKKGKKAGRAAVSYIVCGIIALESLIVAIDGLGSNGVWVPFARFFPEGLPAFCDCWLDLFDCVSEGLMMPLGALITALMIGWYLRPKFILDELHDGINSSFFDKFYTVCIRFVVPIAMAFILAGQIIDFFSCPQTASFIQPLAYGLSGAILVIFFVASFFSKKSEQ